MSGTAPTAGDATNFTAATDAQVSEGIALFFGVVDGTQNTATPVGLTITPQQLLRCLLTAAFVPALNFSNSRNSGFAALI